MLTRKEQSLLEALLPRAQAEGVEIITLEIVGSKKAPTIRVYIDTAHGVSFDELASTQAWVNAIMDEIDPFPGAYTLEVSSPGIDRPLRTPDHFNAVLGQTAVIKTNGPVQGRSSFTGEVLGATDEAVGICCDEVRYELPYDSIKRAHLKGAVSF